MAHGKNASQGEIRRRGPKKGSLHFKQYGPTCRPSKSHATLKRELTANGDADFFGTMAMNFITVEKNGRTYYFCPDELENNARDYYDMQRLDYLLAVA